MSKHTDRPISYESLVSVLYIMNKTSGLILDLKICNLICIAEEYLFDKNMIGSTYIMKRCSTGAYSKKLVDHLKALSGNGFLSQSGNSFSRNEKTGKILREIQELLQDHYLIFNELDIVINKYKKKTIQELMRCIPEDRYISERVYITIHQGQDIIDPLSVKSHTTKYVEFLMDDVWYDSVEILLDPKIMAGIKKSLDDVRKGRVILRTK